MAIWLWETTVEMHLIIFRIVLTILLLIRHINLSEEELDSAHVAFFDRNKDDNDHYTQLWLLYSKAMNDEDRKNLIHNIVEHMKGIKGEKKTLLSIDSYAISSELILSLG